MSELFCPSCGKEHIGNERYCSYCNEDLEDIIIEYKDKQLPISIKNDKPKEVKPIDAWAERRETVLKIKEQERERERIESLQKPKEEETEVILISNVNTKLIFGFLFLAGLSGVLLYNEYFVYRLSQAVNIILFLILLLLAGISFNFMIHVKRIVRYAGRPVLQRYAERRRESAALRFCSQMCDFDTAADRQYRRDLWGNMPGIDKLLSAMFILIAIVVIVLFFTVI